jgi:hypothetical protein
VALASGLQSGTVHSFDMFRAGPGQWFDGLRKYGLQPNDSFEDRYRENVKPYLDRITIHSGDLLAHRWNGEPVEVLFLDICKTPALHDYCAATWFPRLIPGRSILIQQDYGWRYFEWGNVMMEHYKRYFQILDDVPTTTRAYLCIKPITECPTYGSIPDRDKLLMMDDALKSVASPKMRDNLLFNAISVAHAVNRLDLSRKYAQELCNVASYDVVMEAAQVYPQFFHESDLKRAQPKPLGILGIVQREALRLVRPKPNRRKAA